MTATQDSTLVFKDQAGDYYLVPQGMLEQGRVPAERRAEVERLVAEGNTAEADDTQGHILPILLIGAIGGVVAASAIGYGPGSGDVPLYHILEPYTR
jgi:hypothetical protein